MESKTVIVLGADGYLGWPTSLRLSLAGHRVVAVDSLIRRRWDRQCGTASLFPIASMPKRVRCWQAVTGRHIRWHRLDLLNAEGVEELIREFQPDAVVHFAEQCSAPFSMIDRRHAVMTQHNNVVGTLNLLFSLRNHAPHCHLIKLGTMGEYGTPNIDIEEGFITIEHNGRRDVLPFPKQPGSLYHLSKVHDSHNIQFACRVWRLRSTDLNQGVVYGCSTEETRLHPDLTTKLSYDDIWGTVLNRFCVQAAVELPLTVYGQGGQTRGFLDIRDTLACIELSLNNPPDAGEYRVFNQFTEQFTVSELAGLVRDARAAKGLSTVIAHVPNPRVELEQHYYNAKHRSLLDLGLQPHFLSTTLLEDVIERVEQHRHRVDLTKLQTPSVNWRPAGYIEHAGTPPPFPEEQGLPTSTLVGAQ